ncbi:hypothetical protein [Celeribacter sp.]|uniref:hypothetical protein n=1 Tax=Celeribacter sp. TaxID=1890673 RepID=UPI003A946518
MRNWPALSLVALSGALAGCDGPSFCDTYQPVHFEAQLALEVVARDRVSAERTYANNAAFEACP